MAATAVRMLDALSSRLTVVGLAVAEDRLREVRELNLPLVFYHPIGDVIPRLAIDRMLNRSRRRLVADAVFVCSDTWIGRVSAAILLQMGRRVMFLRKVADARRVHDMRALVLEESPICIVADGRDESGQLPQGRVHPGLYRFVESREAVAVPVSVAVSSAMRLLEGGRVQIPTPGSVLAVAVGSPVLEGAKGGEIRAGSLEKALLASRAAAEELLHNHLR